MQIRNSLVCNGLKLTKLETRADFESKEIGTFDCGFEDLNDFFKNDAYENKKMLFSETYSVHLDQPDTPEIVALISFSNDCVTKNKTVAKHLKNKDIPHSTMRYKSYPAVKITRFGVKKKYQGQDLGTYI
ncbi:MAG: hypothetical protein KAI72_05825 [Candidatus Pacebacteria bacterium]|nr:hypothetical protein [Candidatus Paceibacterota bacterium]